jgi:hypothetical protein
LLKRLKRPKKLKRLKRLKRLKSLKNLKNLRRSSVKSQTNGNVTRNREGIISRENGKN